MAAKEKILVIVYRSSFAGKEYLSNQNLDLYVAAGNIGPGETAEEAAVREAAQELGVKPHHSIDLHHQLRYVDPATHEEFVAHCYGINIKGDLAKLDEARISYRWLKHNQFTKTTWWDEDRSDLRTMVEIIESRA